MGSIKTTLQKRIPAIVLILTAGFLYTSGRYAVAAKEITHIVVRAKNTVSGPKILLGEISSIQGDLEIIGKIENIVLGSAPFPGKERNIRKKQIITRLKQHNISLKEVRLECPDKVKVISECTRFSAADIEKLTRRFILENMPWKAERVKISNFSAKSIVLPKGVVSYTFAARYNEDYLGRLNAEIFFKVDGILRKKIRVSSNISVSAPVAVCSRTIERHAILGPEDIMIENRNITYIANKAVMDIREVVGKRTKTGIAKGTILKYKMFEIAPLVHKGDIITILVETDFINITAPGEVLENGCIGDTIKVCNLTSKKKIYGSVKSSKEIEVKLLNGN